MKKISNFKFQISNSQRGFTLIELLVAVLIIAILASILFTNFIGVRERARDSQRKSDLRQIQTALEMYRADYGSYPVFIPTCNTDPLSRLPTPVLLAAAKCTIDSDCNSRTCRDAFCFSGSCYYVVSANGTACNGGTCQGGVCVGSTSTPTPSPSPTPTTSGPTNTATPTSTPTSSPTGAQSPTATDTGVPSTPTPLPTGSQIYIKKIPCDPAGSGYYNDGNYYYTSNGLNYILGACLENEKDSQGIQDAGPLMDSSCKSGFYFQVKNP